jgi:hypothetical protein
MTPHRPPAKTPSVWVRNAAGHGRNILSGSSAVGAPNQGEVNLCRAEAGGGCCAAAPNNSKALAKRRCTACMPSQGLQYRCVHCGAKGCKQLCLFVTQPQNAMTSDTQASHHSCDEYQELAQRIHCTLQNLNTERAAVPNAAADPGWMVLERALHAGAQTLRSLHN